MAAKADEVKIGLVIVVSLVILAGFIIAMLGIKLGQPMEDYTTDVSFAGGIQSGTVVRFGGMQVGRVTDVSVSDKDNTRIQVAMRINAETPIKTDSEVFINSIGFLGDYYLEITTGTLGSSLLPGGSEIPSRELASINDMLASAQAAVEKVDAAMEFVNTEILREDFPKLRDRIAVIADKVTQLLTDVDLVFSEENRENIAVTLSEIKMMVEENRGDIRSTISNFQSASERLESLATTLDSVATEKRDDIELLIDEIVLTVTEIRSMSERIEQLVADNANDVSLTIDNLKVTSANARDFSETISDEPWRLIWRTQQPEKAVIRAREEAPVEQ